MLDRILAPALTFIVLIGSTIAFALALFYEPRPEVTVAQGMPTPPVVLETVVITGKRAVKPATSAKSATAPTHLAAEGRGVLLHRAQD
jgi:hypothetical protein